jgi:hypothetical protein
MGIRPEEFGELSLGELAALDRLYVEERNRDDWRAAVIACTMRNVWRDKDTRALEPEELMPWLRAGAELAPKKRRRRQTPLEMRAVLEQVTLAMGGTVTPLTQEQIDRAKALEEKIPG